MMKTDDASASGALIHQDNMRLTVTNISPVFQEKSGQETRQEIEALLYRIFQKYA